MNLAITLVGPESSTTITAESRTNFYRFLRWLEDYNPAEKYDLDYYPIRTENRLRTCRVKASKLGLMVPDNRLVN